MEEQRLCIHFVGDIFRDIGEISTTEVDAEYIGDSEALFAKAGKEPWSSNHIVFIAFLSEQTVHDFVRKVREEYSSLFNRVSLVAYILGDFTVSQDLIRSFDYMLFHPLDPHNILNIIQYVWMKKQQLIVEKKLSYLNGTLAGEMLKLRRGLDGPTTASTEGDLLYAVDDHGIIQNIDDHILHILGFSRKEIIGHHFTEIVAQEEFEDVKKAFTERRTGERRSRDITVHMRRKDGSYEEFTVDAQGVHIPSVSEKPDKDLHRMYVGTLGKARRKGARTPAFDVFNHSQLPLFLYDQADNSLIVNPGFELFSGFSGEEVHGKDPAAFEKRGHSFFHTCLETLFDQAHCTYTTLFVDKSGAERLCEVSLDRVYFEGKQCVLGMYSDISVMMTVLDEAETLIQLSWVIGNSNSMQELLEKTVAQGASILKVAFMLCAVTGESGSSFGYCYYQSGSGSVNTCSEEDDFLLPIKPMIDESIRDSRTVYHSTDEVRDFDRLKGLMGLEGTGRGTFVAAPLIVNQTAIGSLVMFQSTGEPFTLHRTRLFEILTNVIAAGIHKLSLEQELRKSLDTLESRVDERTKDLEDFVYTVSHDLKSPLHAARGFAGMVRKQFAEAIRSDEDAFVLRRLEENIEQSLQMIDKLLQLSRVGTRELKFERVDLHEIVNDYFIELKALRKGEERTRLKIKGHLPVIVADRGRMVQLFTNLFDNSIKYMEKGGVTVEVSAEGRDGHVVITVQDNGRGIDERDLPNLFNIFYRGRREVEEGAPAGAGVGLSIVKKIVDQHGGTIALESKPGAGTRVIIELPEHS
jgi:PAS domain S-box-containing protein